MNMTDEELKRLNDYKDRGTLNRDEALEYHRLLCIEEGHVTPEPKVEGVVEVQPTEEVVVTEQPEPPAQAEEVKPELVAEEVKEESMLNKVMDKLKGE